MAFGLLMLFSTLRFVALGWVEEHLIAPQLHFKYFGFHWVEVLPGWAMYAIHALMALAALGVLLGFWYRISALLFALLFTYCELIDLTYYLNHYYFVSIVSFLLAIVPANRRFSLDALRQPAQARAQCPRWTVLIFQVQIGILYVYAGWAKINSEWLLDAMPLRLWLPAHDDLPLIGPWLRAPWMAWVFSWGGMLYDSLIVFFLLWRPTRWLAYAAVIGFHLMTGLLFPIGMFPYVMIAITPIFFPASVHERLLGWLSRRFGQGEAAQEQGAYRFSPFARRLLLPLIGLHVLFQLLFPWRYLLYEGNLFWNEEGYRFSWRVMLVEKSGHATFYVRDTCSGREGVVVNRDFLNSHQEKQMSFQPDMILQFAHFLAEHYRRQGYCGPEVRAEVYVTWNGRPSQLYLDPKRDLTQVRDGWRQKDWVLPPP